MLAELAIVAIDGADEPGELIADDGEPGDSAELFGEDAEPGVGGDVAAEVGGFGFQMPVVAIERDDLAPGTPGFLLKAIEGGAGGLDGRRFAIASGRDEGDPEGGVGDPGWRNLEGQLGPDGATGEGEEGGRDEGRRKAEAGGSGFEPSSDVNREDVKRIDGIGCGVGDGFGDHGLDDLLWCGLGNHCGSPGWSVR